MTTLARWNPLNDVLSLRERMDRLFQNVWDDPLFFGELARTWMPALDLAETSDNYVVRLEAPGVKQDDIDITLEGSILTIRGKREKSEEHKDETKHRSEHVYGSFTRSLTLPRGVKTDEISATYKEGILEVTLPKREESKPKRIALKAT